MKNFYTIVIASLLLTTSSFGQDTNSVSHISDNLGNTESSRAIYKGTLLTSIGIEYNEEKYQQNEYQSSLKTIGAPIISIGYGIFKFMDFRATIDINYQESHGQSSWYKYPSFSTIEFGSKINLFKQKGWVPELSYSLYYNSDQFVTNTLAFSYNLGEKFRVGGNVALIVYDLEKIDLDHQLYYSLNVRYEFFEGFGAFADVKTQGQWYGWSTSTQIGLFYRLNNNMQFHLNAGKVFHNENTYLNEYFASGGFSWALFGGR